MITLLMLGLLRFQAALMGREFLGLLKVKCGVEIKLNVWELHKFGLSGSAWIIQMFNFADV